MRKCVTLKIEFYCDSHTHRFAKTNQQNTYTRHVPKLSVHNIIIIVLFPSRWPCALSPSSRSLALLSQRFAGQSECSSAAFVVFVVCNSRRKIAAAPEVQTLAQQQPVRIFCGRMWLKLKGYDNGDPQSDLPRIGGVHICCDKSIRINLLTWSECAIFGYWKRPLPD